MARPASSIQCPNCGQPFSAILEQILDVQADPTVKERLLNGRVNVVTCPHCGFRGMVGTPMMYHDATKELALIYVPMEINMPKEQREKLIGDMAQAVMRALPDDAPKGYLLQPGEVLTFQGILDRVLEADGITPEMMEREDKKVQLIEQLGDVKKAERQQLLDDNADLVDLGFLELLTAAAQSASQGGESRKSLKLLNARDHLMETTEAGQELKAQQDALAEASQELQAMGESLTRESFVDLLLDNAHNMHKVDAIGVLGRAILDYETFEVLSARIDATEDEALRQQYEEVRQHLLEISAAYEQQSRAIMQRAADTLRMLIQAPDLQQAIVNNIDRIDDAFLQVLEINIQEASKAGNEQVVQRLGLIQQYIVQLVQASAPPEVQLVNALLSTESEEEAIEILREQAPNLNEEFLHVLGEIANQLRDNGQEGAAQRLERLQVAGQDMFS